MVAFYTCRAIPLLPPAAYAPPRLTPAYCRRCYTRSPHHYLQPRVVILRLPKTRGTAARTRSAPRLHISRAWLPHARTIPIQVLPSPAFAPPRATTTCYCSAYIFSVLLSITRMHLYTCLLRCIPPPATYVFTLRMPAACAAFVTYNGLVLATSV